MVRLALEGVVVHGEDLLVVVLARDRVRDLVEVDELVHQHDEALVAGAHEELGKELEVLVPVVVADAGVDAELGLGLGLCAVLAAQPLGAQRLALLVALEVGGVVGLEHAAEVEAVHELADGGERGLERDHRVAGALREVAGPALEHERQGAALGASFCAQVADEILVRGEPLALVALQAALGREVGVGDHEVAAHRVRADGLEQEGLARAVAAHEEAEARAAVRHQREVVEKCLDLALTANGDVGQADTRHDAALERVYDHGCDAFGHTGLVLRHGRSFLRFFLPHATTMSGQVKHTFAF